MTARLAERRSHYRVRTMLPVHLENASAVMRDMSTTGAYFWINGAREIGETVTFSVQFDSSLARGTVWICQGLVVRKEYRERDIGVAVRITETTLDPT